MIVDSVIHGKKTIKPGETILYLSHSPCNFCSRLTRTLIQTPASQRAKQVNAFLNSLFQACWSDVRTPDISTN